MCPACGGGDRHEPDCDQPCAKCGKVPGPKKPGLSPQQAGGGSWHWVCFDCGYHNERPPQSERWRETLREAHPDCNESIAGIERVLGERE